MKTKHARTSEELTSKLGKLFEDELQDIYWAEQALVTALPKMIGKATSGELVQALEDHLAETKEHVTRLDKVFLILGQDAKPKKCETMD